jgi:hypothetical protein
MEQAEVSNNLFAPDPKLKKDPQFVEKKEFIKTCLYEKYYLAHGVEKEDDMTMYSDMVDWSAPVDFISTVDYVYDYIPNKLILQSVENALRGIVAWSNARNQALQLGDCIKHGAKEKLYKEVAQIGDLMSKIANKKPCGEQTIGVNLLGFNWAQALWDCENDRKKATKNEIFLAINNLTNLTEGKYKYCVSDYPHEPFYQLKSLSKEPKGIRKGYVADMIKHRYPALLDHPEVIKDLGLS